MAHHKSFDLAIRKIMKIISKLKIFLLLLLVSIVMFLLNNRSAFAQLADSPWPMFHGDIRHTGLSKYDTSKVDGTVRWTYKTGAGIESSPTIGDR